MIALLLLAAKGPAKAQASGLPDRRLFATALQLAQVPGRLYAQRDIINNEKKQDNQIRDIPDVISISDTMALNDTRNTAM